MTWLPHMWPLLLPRWRLIKLYPSPSQVLTYVKTLPCPQSIVHNLQPASCCLSHPTWETFHTRLYKDAFSSPDEVLNIYLQVHNTKTKFAASGKAIVTFLYVLSASRSKGFIHDRANLQKKSGQFITSRTLIIQLALIPDILVLNKYA